MKPEMADSGPAHRTGSADLPQGAAPWLTFLSDYGHDDVQVGVCHGVIARHAPQVRVIDVCHAVAAGDIEHGAMLLAAAVPYLPVAVHLAAVDPLRAAGSARAVAVRCDDGSTFVAPDNGLTSFAWEPAGGVREALVLDNEDWWLPHPSPVFRTRDIYAPVASRLAAGESLSGAGSPVDPETLVRLTPRTCSVDDDHVHGEVVAVDHFGNLSLNMVRGDLEAAGILLGDNVEVRVHGRSVTVPFAATYGHVPAGRLCVCEDAQRRVTLAVNLGRATQRLRADRGDPVVVSRVQQVASSEREPVDLPARAR
jgi:S-adenosylmethionine hydrolase